MIKLLYALLLLVYPVEHVQVARVIDGDTLDTSEGRVRVLGINAPEKGERCHDEATAALESLVGSEVSLRRDFVDRDKYDRLLRHLGGGVELAMVRGGYAKAYCLFPNYLYCAELEAAQAEAMNSGAGCLWAPSNDTCLRISRASRAGSAVHVVNYCDHDVSLEGVYVESDGRQREYFSGVICPGCEDWRSLRVGRFAMLFDGAGFVDFSAAT
jgi:endonuclease YncB( thermonuclease family)